MDKFNEREERIEALGRECGATAAMRVNEAAEYQAEVLPGKDAWQYLQDEAGAVTARERAVFVRGFCDQYYEMVDFQKEEKGWRVRSKALGAGAIALLCFLAAGCGDTIQENVNLTVEELQKVVYQDCIAACQLVTQQMRLDCNIHDPRTDGESGWKLCVAFAWESWTAPVACKSVLARWHNGIQPFVPCEQVNEMRNNPTTGKNIYTSPFFPVPGVNDLGKYGPF